MTPPTPQGFWQPSNWYLAQVTHVLASIAIVEAALLHFHCKLIVVSVLLAGITGFKEFAIDCSPFENDTVLGSAQDWLCYLLGLGVAALAQYDAWLGIVLGVCVIGCLFGIDVVEQHRSPSN